MNSVTSDPPNGAFVPADERWVHEPEFKRKLDSADKWMRHFVTIKPDDGSERLLMYMEFQCEIQSLDAQELGKVVTTLKKLQPMSWDGILKDIDLECKELASAPGKYALRLSDSHRAIVGRDGRRMLYLALDDEPTSTGSLPAGLVQS